MTDRRDHGGGLDAAIARYGGSRAQWLDLSTGINPVPYPIGEIGTDAWTNLPEKTAMDGLLSAARNFWNVPDDAQIIAAPGVSALITRMPELSWNSDVYIPSPTYNEHAAAFARIGSYGEEGPLAKVRVFVHPNNPDGQRWDEHVIWGDHQEMTIIDESFCDVSPKASHVGLTGEPGIIALKSFGKFWGLAGLRLGFAIGTSHTLARPGNGSHDIVDLAELLGPWPISGPALSIGTRALLDKNWANKTRLRLKKDANRLDILMAPHSNVVGGTDLFRLYKVDNAAKWQKRLAQNRIWSRIFPYSDHWIRLGLPAPDRWSQLEAVL